MADFKDFKSIVSNPKDALRAAGLMTQATTTVNKAITDPQSLATNPTPIAELGIKALENADNTLIRDKTLREAAEWEKTANKTVKNMLSAIPGANLIPEVKGVDAITRLMATEQMQDLSKMIAGIGKSISESGVLGTVDKVIKDVSLKNNTLAQAPKDVQQIAEKIAATTAAAATKSM